MDLRWPRWPAVQMADHDTISSSARTYSSSTVPALTANPVIIQLMLNDNSLTPIARYRRAKLGIVSKSRRAFLEILPAGVNIIDLVVVTFVSYAKQYLLPESPNSSGSSS